MSFGSSTPGGSADFGGESGTSGFGGFGDTNGYDPDNIYEYDDLKIPQAPYDPPKLYEYEDLKVNAAKPQESIWSYGLKGFLTGLTTGSLGAAAIGALVGVVVGLYKNYTPDEAKTLAAQGEGIVLDTTTGKYLKAKDLGIDERGLHTVESDSAGKITNYAGTVPTGNKDMENTYFSATPSSFNTGSAAANTQASYEQQALDYLKERDLLPKQFSEEALRQLGGLYDMPGGTGSQQDLIDRATQSPLYQSIMGGREAGEESILRSASATGGLRSGNVQSNLYDYNVQLQNKALLESYNQQLQGLSGMAGLPGYAPQIAQQTSQIGSTLGQGMVASEQMEADKKQTDIDNLMGLGSLGLSLYDSFNFSDRRLKNNIEKITEVDGHNWYVWDWNIVANKMGLKGKSEGVLADEIVNTNPDCIGFKDGFMIVNYTKLGIFTGEVKHAC